MKRKYDNPEVKVGDWVYIKDMDYSYESVCKYKVIGIVDEQKIIVEVKNNKEDRFLIYGWTTDNKLDIKKLYNLPSGTKAWFVSFWEKEGGKCLSIE